MLSLYLRENDQETAKLSFQSRRVEKIRHAMPEVVDITGSIGSDRERVEAFIKAVFRQSYQAHIAIHYPYLISVSNQKGEILAAAGFRYAHQSPLFLEQYTGMPIERRLAGVYGKNINRRQIVEIGSLASLGGGSSLFLFAALASYLDFKDVHYTVMTGTQHLHRNLKMLGLQLQKICAADKTLLKADADDWGSYYATHPSVLTGSVKHGVETLRSTLGSVYEHHVPFRYHTGKLS
jgi:hypothetical protein